MVLPDTTSSTRWVDFDAPYLTTAFTPGFSSSQFKIDNAQGGDETELTCATADISAGAKVLVVCPLDGPTGVAIAKLADQKGVTLIAIFEELLEDLLRQLQQREGGGADRQRLQPVPDVLGRLRARRSTC